MDNKGKLQISFLLNLFIYDNYNHYLERTQQILSNKSLKKKFPKLMAI